MARAATERGDVMRMYMRNIRINGKAEVPYFTFPGGHVILYGTRDGCIFCGECATDILRKRPLSQDIPVWMDAYEEGRPVQCDGCGKTLESSYGDPDEEESSGS